MVILAILIAGVGVLAAGDQAPPGAGAREKERQAFVELLKAQGIDLRPVENRSNAIEHMFSVGPHHDRKLLVGVSRLPRPMTPMEVVGKYPIAIPNVVHGRWVLWRVGGPGGNASKEFVAVWERVQAALKATPVQP